MAGADSETKRIVFLGPPNSGKGTQAVMLARKIGIPAISTGEMLRAAVAVGSELGGRVREVMDRGALVDDELMVEVVSRRLAENDAVAGFLLDGYPRTAAQARSLAELSPIDDVVLLDAPEEVLVKRALGRGRTDDREEVVRERLRVYREQTAPLIEEYENQRLLRRVDGDQTIEEVEKAILCVLARNGA